MITPKIGIGFTPKNMNQSGSTYDVLSRGMIASRFEMDIYASNISNAHSTRINGIDPERRKFVEIQSSPTGPKIIGIGEDMSPLPEKYDPGNPHANARGYVTGTNINEVKASVNMMNTSRAYELMVNATNVFSRLNRKALTIGDR